MQYSDEIYREAIAVLIDDIHYSNASYSSKVANVRKYAELIVRRLLHYNPQKQLTLGHTYTREKLLKKGYTEKLFIDSLDVINGMGSDRAHTQVIPVATEDEYKEAVANLFNLYAYLFVDFFKRNKFGSNIDILRAFSILPAEIRYSTLLCLYEMDRKNTSLIDKLVLSTVKVKGTDACIEWIEENKTDLEAVIQEFSSEEYKVLIETYGILVATSIAKEMTKNMYDVSIEKAKIIGSQFIPLYSTMEEALRYYNTDGIIVGETDDVREFNDLMHYVYFGRKEEIRKEFKMD